MLLGLVIAIFSVGCPTNEDLCEKGSCVVYATSCRTGIKNEIHCTSIQSEGEDLCSSGGGVVVGTEDCLGGATAGPYYPNWDPDAASTLVNGVYEVDSSLLDQIRGDFNTVTLMDSSRLEFLSTGYGKLTNIGSSDMVHHLGFQNDDIILSVSDGVTGTIYLDSWADYIEAIALYGATTTLTVSVERNSSTITLDYAIV